jgi:hypothetical protein
MEKRIVTYSFLALINNRIEKKATTDTIFIPLIKRGISKMCAMGKRDGNDIKEIVNYIDQSYELNMPLSLLKSLLKRIEKEANVDGVRIQFFNDWSFVLRDYYFDDYDDEISRRENQLVKLQEVYEDFLRMQDVEPIGRNVFHFIESGKMALGKYIQARYPQVSVDNTLEAKFIKFIADIPGLYEIVQSVYIGSIISIYLEYQPTNIKKNVELLFDTNFIISLLDLNTPVSTVNCRRLWEISKGAGFTFTVLSITLKEVERLLSAKVRRFDEEFLAMMVDEEDIYNACKRRNLTKTDLDDIRAHIEDLLAPFDVNIVHHVDAYENRAKFGEEYEKLRPNRNSDFAALHDATCIEYVKVKRVKIARTFDAVNCWFLNNSSTRHSSFVKQGVQPYSIKSEELLNLLWLANPGVKNELNFTEFADIGLSRLVTTTLDDSLPRSSTIRELDSNLRKYGKDKISDEDIVRVSKSIAERTVANLEELNALAQSDQTGFIKNIQDIANKRREAEENYVKVFADSVKKVQEQSKEMIKKMDEQAKRQSDLEGQSDEVRRKYEETVELNDSLSNLLRKKSRELVDEKNVLRAIKRKRFIDGKIRRWRTKMVLLSVSVLVLIGLVHVGFASQHGWDFGYIYDQRKSGNTHYYVLAGLSLLGVLFTIVFVPALREVFFSLTQKEKYRNTLEIPADYQDISYDDD